MCQLNCDSEAFAFNNDERVRHAMRLLWVWWSRHFSLTGGLVGVIRWRQTREGIQGRPLGTREESDMADGQMGKEVNLPLEMFWGGGAGATHLGGCYYATMLLLTIPSTLTGRSSKAPFFSTGKFSFFGTARRPVCNIVSMTVSQMNGLKAPESHLGYQRFHFKRTDFRLPITSEALLGIISVTLLQVATRLKWIVHRKAGGREWPGDALKCRFFFIRK